MAIVTDIGSLQDKSFNQLANEGRLRVGKQLGIQTRVYVTKKAEDRLPNLLAAASAGYDLIFARRLLQCAEHLNAVAPRYPGTEVRRGRRRRSSSCRPTRENYTGIVFAEHEAGYLVGYLAALSPSARAEAGHQRGRREPRARRS